jgi:hypothetical protein
VTLPPSPRSHPQACMYGAAVLPGPRANRAPQRFPASINEAALLGHGWSGASPGGHTAAPVAIQQPAQHRRPRRPFGETLPLADRQVSSIVTGYGQVTNRPALVVGGSATR